MDKNARSNLERKIALVLTELQLEIRANAVTQSAHFILSIIKANRSLRLTGAKSEDELVNKHLMDSLYLLKFMPLQAGNMLDLGAGAGFPGIPIKILCLDNPLFVLDASRKKINFLKYTIEEIGLNNIEFLMGRAEEWARDGAYRENFKFVLCRAVADMAVLMEIGLPFLSLGGSLIIYKGPGGDKELLSSKKAMTECGGEMDNKFCYRLKSGEERRIYVLRKVKITPPEYPRKIGIPFKKPIFD